MDEIEEWFEREFGHMGFYLTPLMVDTTNFTPMRGVMYNDGTNGRHCNLCGRMTHIKITPELANDLSGGFVSLPDPVQEMRELVRQEIHRFLEQNLNKPTNFTPKKLITKFKFK